MCSPLPMARRNVQTNLKVHIDHIVNSGCTPSPRKAMGVQRQCRNKDVHPRTCCRSRVKAAQRDKTNLTKSFRQVLESLRDEFGNIQLVDPANTNNIVSQLCSSSEATMVSHAAKSAFDAIGESDDADDWKSAFRDTLAKASLGVSFESATRSASRDRGEQLLSDFGISEDLRYRLKIDARVSQDGFRDFFLRGSPYHSRVTAVRRVNATSRHHTRSSGR